MENQLLDTTEGDSGLDALFEAIGGNTALPQSELAETLATVNPDAGEVIVPDEGDLEAAIASIEADEAVAASDATDATESPAIEPTVEPAQPAKAKGGKKAKLTDEERAEREAKKATDKAARDAARTAKKQEREAKLADAEAKPKLIYFGNDKVGRMKHRMGEATLRDCMVLTPEDAALTGDDLTKRQDENIAKVDKMAIKVKNRASYLLEFMQGKTQELNNIMAIAFRVLNRDGKIVTGEKGNFAEEMAKRPYGAGTIRAAGVNTVNVLKELKVVIPGAEKMTFVPNPDSLILAKVNALLGA